MTNHTDTDIAYRALCSERATLVAEKTRTRLRAEQAIELSPEEYAKIQAALTETYYNGDFFRCHRCKALWTGKGTLVSCMHRKQVCAACQRIEAKMHLTAAAIEKTFTLPGLAGEKAHASAAARAIFAAIETIEADGCEVTDYKVDFCNNGAGVVTAAIETIYFRREGKDYFCLGMANYLNGHAKPLI